MASAPEDSFTPWLIKSLALHLLILALFIIKSFSLPDQNIEIESAIRVDLVALPDKNPSLEPATPEKKADPPKSPPPASKPEVKTPVQPEPVVIDKKSPIKNVKKENSLEIIKKRQEESLRKMKQEAAAEKIKREMEQERATAQRRSLPKGNEVLQGDSLTGTQKIQHDRYFSEIEKKVKQAWHLPGWLNNTDFKAEALVRIDENGFIVFKKIITSSGNETFDGQVLAALESAGQFDPPPSNIRSHLIHKGVVFKFPH